MSQRPSQPPQIKITQQLNREESRCDVGDDPENEEYGCERGAEDVVDVFDSETECHHSDPGEHPVYDIAGGAVKFVEADFPGAGKGEVEEREEEVEDWEKGHAVYVVADGGDFTHHCFVESVEH